MAESKFNSNEYRAAWLRNKCATDPEFREKRLAAHRRWAARNPDYMREKNRAYREKHKDRLNAQNKEWRKKNRARHVATSTAWRKRNPHLRQWYHIKSKYGLTKQAYEELLLKQAGVCWLCQKAPKPTQKFVVDHDHATGKVRALLHMGCNAALSGLFGDNPENMRLAADRFKRGVE